MSQKSQCFPKVVIHYCLMFTPVLPLIIIIILSSYHTRTTIAEIILLFSENPGFDFRVRWSILYSNLSNMNKTIKSIKNIRFIPYLTVSMKNTGLRNTIISK